MLKYVREKDSSARGSVRPPPDMGMITIHMSNVKLHRGDMPNFFIVKIWANADDSEPRYVVVYTSMHRDEVVKALRNYFPNDDGSDVEVTHGESGETAIVAFGDGEAVHIRTRTVETMEAQFKKFAAETESNVMYANF